MKIIYPSLYCCNIIYFVQALINIYTINVLTMAINCFQGNL